MNAEFNWWLLIVGLVAGAALVWLVLADSNRRDADILEEELPTEAAWIAEVLASRGEPADPAAVERVLRLHRAYLSLPPPDGPDDALVDPMPMPEARESDAPIGTEVEAPARTDPDQRAGAEADPSSAGDRDRRARGEADAATRSRTPTAER